MEQAESFDHLMDGGDSYANTCDMRLLVEGKEIPVHSHTLIIHSRFFRKLITDIRAGNVKSGRDPLLLPLDNTKRTEVDLLLKFMYSRDANVDKFEDACILVTLADKFDMPSMVKICEPVLCRETVNMHFAGCIASMPHATRQQPLSPTHHHAKPDVDENHDAAKWLSMAERWNLLELKVKCQAVILQTLAYTDIASTNLAFQKLHEYRISLASVYAIAAVLGKCLGHFGKCSCGKIFSSLRCASCFLENTSRGTRNMCERLLFEHEMSQDQS